MKKVMGLIFVVCLWSCLACFITGCDQEAGPENIAVIASANLSGGDNGKIELIDTANPFVDHTVLDGVKNPTHVLTSPDGLTAYICGSSYSRIAVVDILTKTVTNYDINGNRIWDMALSKDGTKLIVGMSRGILNFSEISVYDTSDMTVLHDFSAYEDELFPTSVYGCKLAVHPTNDFVYVISKDILSLNIYVRTFSFSGGLVGTRIKIASQSWFGGDFDDYDIGISPDGKLLLAVSSDIYPFVIDDLNFELLPLYANAGIGVDNSPALKGNSTLLFSENGKYVYVNSRGIRYLNLINDGGGSLLLSRKKISAEEENPVLYDMIDFMEDLVPYLSEYLVEDTYQDIVDLFLGDTLFGIAASTIQGNTCYMLVAPVVDATAIAESGVYLLLISSYDPFLGMNVMTGVRLLTEYPNGISVNSDRDTMIISYSQSDVRKVEIIKRDSLLGWSLSGSKKVDLENNPRAMGIVTH